HFSIPLAYFEFFRINLDSIRGAVVSNNSLMIPQKVIKYPSIQSRSGEIKIPKSDVKSASKIQAQYDIIEQLKHKYINYLERAHFLVSASTEQLENQYRKLNSLFKIGMKEIIRLFTNDFSLTSISSIKYRYGKNEYPIQHKNERKNEKILISSIDPASLPETLLRRVILLGCAIDEKIQLDDDIKLELCKEGIPIFINIATFWRQDYDNYIHKEFKKIHHGKLTHEYVLEDILVSFTAFTFLLAYPQVKLKPEFAFYLLNNKLGLDELASNLNKNCKYNGITDKSTIKEIQKGAVSLFKMYSEFCLSNANIQFKEDFIPIISNAKVDNYLFSVKKSRIDLLDKRILFEDEQISNLIRPIKLAHMKIKDQKRVTKLNKVELKQIFESINKKEILNVLSIIDENKNLINNLNETTKLNLKYLTDFIQSNEIEQIIASVNRIYNKLFFFESDDTDEQFSSVEELSLEDYLFWMWLVNQKGKEAIIFFCNKNYETDSKDIEDLLRSIKMKLGAILNVYRSIN
ncbi:MAG: hypothetical protein ACTSQE_15380, partial [Candidatus Heimdallarchaeaceae archaeon]